MATPGEMIQVMARALLLPEVTVGSYYRAIREAGLVKTGGRGRSAAHVSALDVARLLISIMTAELVRNAAETLRVFGELRQTESEVDLVRPISGTRLGLGPEHRFEDATMAVLLTLAAPTWQRPAPTIRSPAEIHRFGVEVEIADLRADLHTYEASLTYTRRPGAPGERNGSDYGLRVRKSLGGPSLLLLASLVAAGPMGEHCRVDECG